MFGQDLTSGTRHRECVAFGARVHRVHDDHTGDAHRQHARHSSGRDCPQTTHPGQRQQLFDCQLGR